MEIGIDDRPETVRPEASSHAGRTTTAESLLGILSLGAMTGYEIRQVIGFSIGNFWNESFGQIYPALKRLVAEGLAEVEEQSSEAGPRRKLYRLTDAGRDRLLAWLSTPVYTQVPRNELLLKVFFGKENGPRSTAEHVKRFVAEQRRLLARYGAIERTIEVEQGTNPGMPYWRLTVRYGLRQTEALLRWAEEALEELGRFGE